MDLIGKFHPPSSKGNRYTLMVICMHTGFVFCIPLKTKSASDVVKAYIDRVYSQFGSSEKVLSDNGTEFKNKLMDDLCGTIGSGAQNLFSTLLTTIKWKNRIIPLLPKGMYLKAHNASSGRG